MRTRRQDSLQLGPAAIVFIALVCINTAEARRKLLLSADDPVGVQAAVQRYLDNAELEAHMKNFTSRCSAISRLKRIGRSVRGRPIWALEISDKPGRLQAEPNVKLVGTVHGDEPLGRVLTLGLAEWLCKNYKIDDTAKRILNDVHLWLVPTLNPDGFPLKIRTNFNGVDLNRNFPDRFTDPTCNPTGTEQPETKVMMNFSLTTPFVASIGFHTGALVANYPWDGNQDETHDYTASPDDATFRYLAKTYAETHPSMASHASSEFESGITNGADWYPIYGSMQDWNYVRAGCMELTIEASVEKWPAEEKLPQLFKDNLAPMLAFITKAGLGGVRGRIVVPDSANSTTFKPAAATISVRGIGYVTKSSSLTGAYSRPLVPGNYTVTYRKAGYRTIRLYNVTVPEDGSGIVRNIVMKRR